MRSFDISDSRVLIDNFHRTVVNRTCHLSVFLCLSLTLKSLPVLPLSYDIIFPVYFINTQYPPIFMLRGIPFPFASTHLPKRSSVIYRITSSTWQALLLQELSQASAARPIVTQSTSRYGTYSTVFIHHYR